MEAVTFEALASETEQIANHTTEEIAKCLEELARGLRAQAAKGTDLPVRPEQEEAKRDNIRLWRSEADRIDQVRYALRTIPVSGEQLKREIDKMLADGWLAMQKEMSDFFHERAANIAQVYMGRVLPEQPVNSQANREFLG